MIGLGRMGANMVSRLAAAGHDAVVYDRDPNAVAATVGNRVMAAASLDALAAALETPRIVWLMVPAGVLDDVIAGLNAHLTAGDVIVDGGNSRYVDTLRRAREAGERGFTYVDVGTSGGIWGREVGYCQMVGCDSGTFERLEPVFAALAAGEKAQAGYLHCGPSGAGHFVKMVHNGIEYGVMQAYAEGLNLMQRAANGEGDLPRFDLDLAAITELWRHGSVIRSWLLDLTAAALAADPALAAFDGRVADSGEGRWTLEAAIERGVPMPAITAALYARFESQGHSDFADRALSAMRKAFGGHVERKDD